MDAKLLENQDRINEEGQRFWTTFINAVYRHFNGPFKMTEFYYLCSSAEIVKALMDGLYNAGVVNALNGRVNSRKTIYALSNWGPEKKTEYAVNDQIGADVFIKID